MRLHHEKGLERLRAWCPICREPRGPGWELSLPGEEASPFPPAVPPACHKQRTEPVSSGQPRSLRERHCAGRWPLTCLSAGRDTTWHARAHGLDRPCRARPADPVLVAQDRRGERGPRPDGVANRPSTLPGTSQIRPSCPVWKPSVPCLELSADAGRGTSS
jgi:hypothetical protein